MIKAKEKIKEWNWRMDWCKRNGVSPANKYFWNESKEEYLKVTCTPHRYEE